jgi:hypothetical protein
MRFQVNGMCQTQLFLDGVKLLLYWLGGVETERGVVETERRENATDDSWLRVSSQALNKSQVKSQSYVFLHVYYLMLNLRAETVQRQIPLYDFFLSTTI